MGALQSFRQNLRRATSGRGVFVDPGLENEFISQFRRAAIPGAINAALAAAMILLAFAVVARLTEPHSALAISLRLVLVAILVLSALFLYRAPEYAKYAYVPVAGGASALTLAVTVYLLSLGPHGAREIGGGSPALIFGLFLHYSFLRLPVWWAACIGLAASVASFAWAAPLVVGGSAELRAGLYLAFVNIAGIFLCHSIEARERELFLHRRRAESAQAELEVRAVAAEEAHMEKTRLLAAVSHDLRQPMMAATAYLSVLGNRVRRREYELAERQMEHLEGSLSLLETTLDHLLTAARYDSGTELMRVEMCEIAPLLRQVEETFGPDAASRGIELRVRMPAERLLVKTDSTALWRVMMNLVSNAIKFTEANGRAGRGVLVSARLLGDRCRIDIVDTGAGIPGEHVDAVWQPYFQLGNPERDRSKGLGLGLFLVKRALEHLPDHRLALRSRVGRGSRFSIFLPGTRLGEARVVRPARAPLRAADLELLRGAYVLVLEDDHEARHAILALLDDWGVLYSAGATLEELLADASSATRAADALVTDYRLPGGRNGSECIALVRTALEEPVPAIIVTAESDLDRIRLGVPEDTQVLQKPFDPAALAARLRDAAGRARGRELDEMEPARPAI